MKETCGCHRCREDRRRVAERVREACADCAKLVMFPCGTIKAGVRNMVVDRIRALDLDKLLEEE